MKGRYRWITAKEVQKRLRKYGIYKTCTSIGKLGVDFKKKKKNKYGISLFREDLVEDILKLEEVESDVLFR